MGLESYERCGIFVVKICDEKLDASTAPDFKSHVLNFVANGKTRILLDLGKVDFIDSSGLGAIVTILKRVSDGGDLCICNPKEPIKNMFKLTRMERVFRIFSSEEEAINAMCKENCQ